MTKLFVSENDHEKAALSLAFLKITTILFRFRPKNKKRNYSSLNNFLKGKMNNTANLKINWTTIVNNS